MKGYVGLVATLVSAARERRPIVLITGYRMAVEAVLLNLSSGTLGQAVAIANASDEVRGYEDIKHASVARFRARLADVKGAS